MPVRPRQILLRGMCALTMIGSLALLSANSAGAATASPITVGFLCSCTGGGGFGVFLADGEKVYQAWADSVNASGGIDGHKIKVIDEDDTGNPGTAVSAAQTLIADHVDALVDQSLVDASWDTAAKASNIPVVGADNNSVVFGSNPDFYPVGETELASIIATDYVAKEAGVKKLSLMYCAQSVTCTESIPVFQREGAKLGDPVVYKTAITGTEPNYDAVCLASQQAGANGVLTGQVGIVNIRIAAGCEQQGYKPIWITQGTGYGADEATAPQPGISTNMWAEFDDIPQFANTPGIKAENAALDKYYPGLNKNTELYLEEDSQVWDAGLLLEAAVKASGLTASQTASPAEVVKGLDSLKANTLGGMAPPLTFKAGQGHVIDCWFTARVTDGVPKLENSGKYSCPKS